MNYMLSEAHIKMLKIIIGILTAIITILAIVINFLCISHGVYYHHPTQMFGNLFAITSCISAYRFYRMLHDNRNQISSLQLKIWSMLFVRAECVPLLYLAIYAKHIFGIITFVVCYILTFICNHYLVKAKNNGNK